MNYKSFLKGCISKELQKRRVNSKYYRKNKCCFGAFGEYSFFITFVESILISYFMGKVIKKLVIK